MQPSIATIGHSTRPIASFLNKLKENNIEILVDVRTIPYSRFCPQFSRIPLTKALAKEGIEYVWKGENLGGRGVNVEYEETIDELAAMARGGTNVCVMCSEGDYKKCHRFTLLTPSFTERGLTVIHIQYDNDHPKHR